MPIFVTILIPVLTDYPLVFAFMGDMLAGGFFSGSRAFSPHSRGRYGKPIWPDGG